MRGGGSRFTIRFAGANRLREGHQESRRCSRDTYPESYITKYTSIRRLQGGVPSHEAGLDNVDGGGHGAARGEEERQRERKRERERCLANIKREKEAGT